MIQSITILILGVVVLLLDIRVRKLERQVDTVAEALKIVDSLLGRHEEAMKEFDHELHQLKRKMEKAEDLIDAHTEMEKEAAKLEREWQEGLNNLLNYEVMK